MILLEIVAFFKILFNERSLIASCKVVFYDHGSEAVSKFRNERKKNKINTFNDMKTIIYMVIGYIGVTKMGIDKSFYLLIAIQLIDFIVRLFIVTSIFIFKKCIDSNFRKLVLSDEKTEELGKSITNILKN